MASPALIRYENPTQLRRVAAAWDDLWLRSTSRFPTGQAEFIAQWIEQIAPRRMFIALAVEQDDQLVAALPLVSKKLAGLVPVMSLPENPWCWAGDLLLDPTADVSRVMNTLWGAIRKLPTSLVWFDSVALESTAWRALMAAAEEKGTPTTSHEQYHIGTVEIDTDCHRDWSAYQAAWSGNHRRHMRKAERKVNEEGGLELQIVRPKSAVEVECLLREGLEVEHNSWKGRGASSILATPRMWNFYLAQAAELARRDQLQLVFLRHEGRAIAFEYGWRVKGTYFSPKVGYDETFSRFSPGQLLRNRFFEQAFADESLRTIDFLGPLTDATAKWATGRYAIGRIVASTGGLAGRALFSLYAKVWRKWRSDLAYPTVGELVHAEPTATPLLAESTAD